MVATAAAPANLFGAGANPPRPPPRPPAGAACGGAGRSTTNFPFACAALICESVSPAVPPKITSAVLIGRGARAPGTATQSCCQVSGLPFTVRREWFVNEWRWYGSTWK